jgi:hypothetical protein
MPTKLPPQRKDKVSQEEDDGAALVIPAIIIVMLLMANLALYFDRYGVATAYTPLASAADLQLSP